MLNAGEQIGPYTLLNKLGAGAFGVVWLAEKRAAIAASKVALKIPLNMDFDMEAVIAEARLWVRASGHPNVMPLIEADVYNGHVVIASEFAPDGSLEYWTNYHGGKAPSMTEAVEMTADILAGLEHLHSRSIIHRDLKPANILLQGARPRLSDFGISRVLKSTGHSGNVAGSPAYMAPEAFDSQRTEQTDIWSVGVILYQLVTGRLPFSQSDMPSLIAGITTRQPDPLSHEIPKPLRNIIYQSLEKRPDDRYQTASQMRTALITQLRSTDLDATTIIPEDEDPLAKIRKRMLVSGSLWDLRSNLYEVDSYLAKNPMNTEARLIKDQLSRAIRHEEPMVFQTMPKTELGGPVIAPQVAARKRSGFAVIIIGFAVGILLVGIILYFVYTWLF